MKRLFLSFILVFGIGASSSFSQDAIQVAWDFSGALGSETSLTPTTIDPDLNPATIARGAGLSASTLSNSFNSTGWTTSNSLGDAIAANDFLAFTLQPNGSFILSLSLLEAVFRRSGTGPDKFQWQYSIDESAFYNLGTEISFTGTATNGVAQSPIDLSIITALQNVSGAHFIRIRLYGYNAASAGGSFAIGRLTGNDLALIGSSNAVTPAKLLSFSAQPINGLAQLRWTAVNVEDVDFYEINQSDDGVRFMPIAKVKGYNHSGTQSYEFIDKEYRSERIFYRLSIMDYNGSVTYSPVISFAGAKRVPVLFYNPNAKTIVVSWKETQQAAIVHFVALNGQALLQRTLELITGKNELSVTSLPNGNYVVVVVTAAGKYSLHFRKTQ
ncbi:MAG: T9SS type A sorting domain-containing protein [Chitinophagaceae bacterium]|nr:T9SS type A sorting domain-containing protein [Chitinophagaceae bacterium]